MQTRLSRLLATAVLAAGGAASLATSEPGPPMGQGFLETSADGTPVLLDGSSPDASATVTIALNEAGVPDYVYGGLFLQTSACVPEEDAPGRLRVSLVPELPIEGSVIEADIAACPLGTQLALDLYAWGSCVAGEACAERYDVHFENVGPAATSSTGMSVTWSVRATAGGYPEDEPPREAELSVVVQ